MTMIRVKICCIQSVDEARMALEHGAAALGLVSRMPSGPGVIDESAIARIAARVPPGVSTFLLTSETDVSAIVDQQRRCRVNTIQLCDRMDLRAYAALRAALPGIALVQVVHVTGEAAVHEAEEVAPHVDALLLDSGNPDRAVKELGGTGRTHDWATSRRIRDTCEPPVFLAGGLRAENVSQAIRAVQPYAVDVCTGVRTEGVLDPSKLSAFFAAARSA
jgi:phosphoribosylanthranilate isomerase